jgi:hypothetical protein
MVQHIEAAIKESEPDIIITHHPADSCTEWALNTAMNRFQPNTWVEVGKEGVDAKIKAHRGLCRLSWLSGWV